MAIESNNDKRLMLALLPYLSTCRHSQFQVFQVLYITVTGKSILRTDNVT